MCVRVLNVTHSHLCVIICMCVCACVCLCKNKFRNGKKKCRKSQLLQKTITTHKRCFFPMLIFFNALLCMCVCVCGLTVFVDLIHLPFLHRTCPFLPLVSISISLRTSYNCICERFVFVCCFFFTSVYYLTLIALIVLRAQINLLITHYLSRYLLQLLLFPLPSASLFRLVFLLVKFLTSPAYFL